MTITVENAVYNMFVEGTGKALCDSGDAYGRHWETNQKKSLEDFKSEPEVAFNEDDLYTISTFHYLLNQDFELDDICHEFNDINVGSDNWDSDIHGVSNKAEKYLRRLGAKKGEGWNTYNGESSLSQVLQGSYIDIEGSHYVLIQLHQGCDVRGGYTDARLFRLTDDKEWLNPEDVYGEAILDDGTAINVDNGYNGYSLTDENGKKVENIKSAKLFLS